MKSTLDNAFCSHSQLASQVKFTTYPVHFTERVSGQQQKRAAETAGANNHNISAPRS